jgi:hypothetical protein
MTETTPPERAFFGTGPGGGTRIAEGFDEAARRVTARLRDAGHDVHLDEDGNIRTADGEGSDE